MEKTILEPANNNEREGYWDIPFIASPPLFSFRNWKASVFRANNMSPSLKAQKQIDDLIKRNSDLWQKLEVTEEMLLERESVILALKKKLRENERYMLRTS